MDIDELPIQARSVVQVKNALRANNISSVSDIARLSVKDLVGMDFMGKANLAAVLIALAKVTDS
jgi:DNA-directed RNA polymerase alpha subunit